MADSELPYDKTDRFSIEAYALRLKDKSLRQLVGDLADKEHKANKGSFGQLVEELYFKYKPNNDSHPDFPEAGVELKTSPIKHNKTRFAAKERLVLNTINYLEEYDRTFDNSSFWTKNRLLLLMLYLHLDGVPKADVLFKIIRLWTYPEKDLEIIKDDWLKISAKIKAGKAHELSEGDTLYLAACTKGAKGGENSTMRPQKSGPDAPQRAYSLKQSYMNTIIDESGIQKDFVPLVRIADLKKGKTFEELIIDRFKPFYGKSEDEIRIALEMPTTSAKNSRALLAFAIMGVRGKSKIEEFTKADIQMKTVVLNRVGTPTEDMSFAQIDYEGIVLEEWEDSYWHSALTKRFFFVVFEERGTISYLKRAFFWTMPTLDLEQARLMWEDTRSKIAHDDFENLTKSSQNPVCFIRTKGRDSKDLKKTPSGRLYKKLGYWLPRKYIKAIIEA